MWSTTASQEEYGGQKGDDDDDSASSWIVDTDEINSEDSEALYEKRPNRWRGAKSTWREYTKEERATADALRRVRDRNLGVHLYNAFAVKRDARKAIGVEVNFILFLVGVICT